MQENNDTNPRNKMTYNANLCGLCLRFRSASELLISYMITIMYVHHIRGGHLTESGHTIYVQTKQRQRDWKQQRAEETKVVGLMKASISSPHSDQPPM